MKRGIKFVLPCSDGPPGDQTPYADGWCFKGTSSTVEPFDEKPPNKSDNMFMIVSDSNTVGAVDPMKGYYTQREFRNLVQLDRFRQIIGWEDYDALDIGCPLYVYWKLPGRCYTGAGFYLSVKCSEEELP